MPIIEKAKQRKTLPKIAIREEVYSELLHYLNYLGYDKKREAEGIGKVIDGALTLLFKREKRNPDYKKYREEVEIENTAHNAVEGD